MKRATPHNILWFTSDMQRFDTIHCLNNPHIHTPNLDRLLADRGYVCGLSGKLHIASPWLGPEKRVEDGYSFFRYSHSPFVRLDQGYDYYGTMIRDRRYKCAIYHGHDYGELYDLERDPWEHHNLWESEEHLSIHERLIRRAFDSLAFSIDLGPRRIGRY